MLKGSFATVPALKPVNTFYFFTVFSKHKFFSCVILEIQILTFEISHTLRKKYGISDTPKRKAVKTKNWPLTDSVSKILEMSSVMIKRAPSLYATMKQNNYRKY